MGVRLVRCMEGVTAQPTGHGVGGVRVLVDKGVVVVGKQTVRLAVQGKVST
jgi:hypothetical protein